MPRVKMRQDVAKSFDIDIHDMCQCGRPNEFIHCPSCGSTNFYGLGGVSKENKVVDRLGNVVNVRVFSCRSCLNIFMENNSTATCTAQPTAAQARTQAIMKKIDNAVPSAQRQAILDDAIKYRAAHPITERSPLDIADEERKQRS